MQANQNKHANKKQHADLSSLLENYTAAHKSTIKSEELDIAWQTRLAEITAELNMAKSSNDAENSARIAKIYVELMSAIDLLQRRS